MAQTIKIKRSTTTASPSSLQQGELAYSQSSKKLFIGQPGGSTGDILVIGGQHYTDIIDDLAATGSIELTGDVTGSSAVYNSSTGKWSISTTIAANSVALGNDTTGDYVATLAGTAGQILTSGATSGEGTTHTLSLANTGVSAATYGSSTAIPVLTIDAKGRVTNASTQNIATTLNFSDGTNNDSISLLTETLTISGGTGLTSVVDSASTPNEVTINLDNTTVSAGTYGSTTAIPTFTVDAQGRLTGASNVSIATSLTIQSDDAVNNTVALATDTLKLLGGTAITSTNTGDDVTFNLDDTAVTAGTYGSASAVGKFTVDAQGRLTDAEDVTISITSSQVSNFNAAVSAYLSGANGITENNGVISLSNSGVTANTYGSSNQLAQFTVNAQGRITSATEFAADFVITGDSGSDTVVLQETLHFDGGTGVTTAVTDNQVAFSIGQDVATTADVTFADVTVNGTLTSDDITSTNISVDGNATITGNLTVNGTTTTVNSETVTLDDPLLTLGGDTAPTTDDNLDRGVEFRWHDGTSAKLGFFGYDDSAQQFTFIPDATNTSNVMSGTAGAAKFGSLALDTDLAVAHGGTGRSSFTSKGIVYGNGGSTLAVTAAGTWDSTHSVGQILSVNSAGTPTWTNTLDGGTF